LTEYFDNDCDDDYGFGLNDCRLYSYKGLFSFARKTVECQYREDVQKNREMIFREKIAKIIPYIRKPIKVPRTKYSKITIYNCPESCLDYLDFSNSGIEFVKIFSGPDKHVSTEP
jgi:hypothetical protein